MVAKEGVEHQSLLGVKEYRKMEEPLLGREFNFIIALINRYP
jgi:hypothetical protein